MGERPIGAWLESKFQHPMRLLKCDQLQPARDGEDADYLVLGQRLVYRPILVILVPIRCHHPPPPILPSHRLHSARRYLSDSLQQFQVCGRMDGGGLINDRHTLDHRAEIPPRGQKHTLHHSRLYQQSHVLHARRCTEGWQQHYGGKGACAQARKALGIGKDPPPYGDKPMDLLATGEVFHAAALGVGMRFNDIVIHAMRRTDPTLVGRSLAPPPLGAAPRVRSTRGAACWRPCRPCSTAAA